MSGKTALVVQGVCCKCDGVHMNYTTAVLELEVTNLTRVQSTALVLVPSSLCLQYRLAISCAGPTAC